MRYYLGILVGIFSFIIFIQIASAAVDLVLPENLGKFPTNTALTGNFTLEYSELLHNSSLEIWVGNELRQTFSLNPFLPDISTYEFKPQAFTYKLKSIGINKWDEFVDENFTYRITATGKKIDGGSWSGTSTDFLETVNAGEGLKSIKNCSLRFCLFIPDEVNITSLLWDVKTTNPNVQTVMRKACGDSSYLTFPVSPDGFVRRNLLCSWKRCPPYSGECSESECFKSWHTEPNNKISTTIEPFDDRSLAEERIKFYNKKYGECGGIYKDGEYQNWGEVEWYKTDSGEKIIINDYNDESNYEIVYFPPNGEMVCAHTGSKESKTYNWEVNSSTSYSGNANYFNSYTKQYDVSSISFFEPPACPPIKNAECTMSIPSDYSAEIVGDAENLNIISNYNEITGKLNLEISSSSKELTREYQTAMNLENFNIPTGGVTGAYALAFRLILEYGTKQYNTIFEVCIDNDGDGYIDINDGGDDCDDTNPNINPGASELCDGLDNDCDGEVDEYFMFEGRKLGEWCGVENSPCMGTVICTEDKLNATCNAPYKASDFDYTDEICGDGIDNDCDGKVDEEFEIVNGKKVKGCYCKNGETRLCSEGGLGGICANGTQTCENHKWSECSIKPRKEICNGIDDDCDGIVDNVNGGTSAIQTQCWCYGGNAPRAESVDPCNNIDDNCNNDIDEFLTCCETGMMRLCSEGGQLGICSDGEQTCVEGKWGKCSIEPKDEVCYNELDDDCDGLVDEYCSPEITCFDGIKNINEESVDCGGACAKPCQYQETSTLWLVLIVGAIIIGALVYVFKFRLEYI